MRNKQFDKNAPIAMLTAYDAPTARIAEKNDIDIILVGDSLGPNMLGYKSVHEVTTADICHHTAAARRGAPNTHIMSDIPWEAVAENNIEHAAEAAISIIASGADSVKLEVEHGRIDLLKELIAKNIPVCSHVGYTPQSPDLSVTVQGKDFNRACEIIQLAKISEQCGAFMLLMELIPAELAELITNNSSIPTIGIGAGPICTGQVQVFYDITGYSDKIYRHSKLFSDGAAPVNEAFDKYRNEVHKGSFPTMSNCAAMNSQLLAQVTEWSNKNV